MSGRIGVSMMHGAGRRSQRLDPGWPMILADAYSSFTFWHDWTHIPQPTLVPRLDPRSRPQDPRDGHGANGVAVPSQSLPPQPLPGPSGPRGCWIQTPSLVPTLPLVPTHPPTWANSDPNLASLTPHPTPALPLLSFAASHAPVPSTTTAGPIPAFARTYLSRKREPSQSPLTPSGQGISLICAQGCYLQARDSV